MVVRMWPSAIGIVALLVFCETRAGAGGLSFSENGAAAAGKANAFVGEADDPSAIFYNPAGMTQLPGTQVMAGTALVHLSSTFRSSTTGESTQLQDQFPLVPHLYVTHRLKVLDERLSLGLGIYHPFGIVIDWPDTWQGRFDSTDARLRVTVFNPVVAFRATPKLSLAAGVRVADVAAEVEQKFNLGNGESKLRAYGLTAMPVGWNVGALYRVTESVSVGITFRSELQAKLRGQADVTGPAAAVFPSAGLHSGLKLPPQLVAGISVKVTPRWTINADVEWEGYRTVGTIPKDFVGRTAGDLSGTRLWTNSYVYRLGTEFAATSRWAVRGGYFFDQSPIPDNTFEPAIPNANLHAVTAGLGSRWETLTLDVAYLFGFYEKRAINNSTLDSNNRAGPTTFGSYSTTAQVLTVSLTKRF